jgi:hypothetical protein
VQELSKFKQTVLVAEVELLDGASSLVLTSLCINSCTDQLKATKPDMSVLKEYKKREEEFLRRAKDLDDVTAARDAEKQKYDDLRKRRLDEFMAGFNLISLKLKEMYQVRASRSHVMLRGVILIGGIDDHFGRKRGTRAGRQHGSVLRGHHLQRHAA